MEFTFIFTEVFAIGIYFVSPLLISLVFLIASLGYTIGRIENWSILDSLYYAFITATTVGYGDFHPLKRRSKCIAILIALIGLLCTGIIVAIGLKAAEVAFTNHYEIEQIIDRIKLRLAV
ncbi:MAG: two pore domain potassium channel family protein [Desulfuromusa sp.]|nr:two pore domain potassium channel family protein [Desulfuromusa sp.]